MGFTTALYEALKLDGDAQACILQPQNLGAGITDSAWITMAGYRNVLFIMQLGTAADAATTIDLIVEQATDNAGTNAGPLFGRRGTKAAATITAGAGFATYNGLVLIYVRAEEMDVNNGFNYLGIQATISAQDTWYISCVAARDVAEYLPVTTTYVTEVVD